MSLAEIRKTQGVTQRQLASRMGVHWVTVSKLERGRMDVTLDYIFRVSDALNAPAVAVFAAAAAQVGRANIYAPPVSNAGAAR